MCVHMFKIFEYARKIADRKEVKNKHQKEVCFDNLHYKKPFVNRFVPWHGWEFSV